MSGDPKQKADPKAKKDDKSGEPEPLPEIEIPDDTWTYDQKIVKK